MRDKPIIAGKRGLLRLRAFLFGRGKRRTILLLALLALLPGCGTLGYYAQALRGQCQILQRKEPIQKLLADTNTPPKLRERLKLVLAIRDFAGKELKLPANGHYQHYADLGRRFAVWNVYAAPEFSLEAKSWWYPVVGKLEYRGYFDEKKARRDGARLQRRGLDVHMSGIEAYSTLGWFRDPVLNTFLYNDDVDLAELIFHELAHQRLFVAGDTDFNEAFATAVAEEGVTRWLRARNDQAELARHREASARKQTFLSLVAGARAELEALYKTSPGRDECDCEGRPANRCWCTRMRQGKEAVFKRLRENYAAAKTAWGGNAEYDAWFGRPLNNAVLNTVDTYYTFVPAFQKLLAVRGGNLEKFFADAAALGKLEKEERARRLRDLLRQGAQG